MDGLAEEAKCEDLEKFAIGDDLKRFREVFPGWGSATTSRERRVGAVS